MNKKEIKKQMYYLDSELYSYQDIDNLKDYAKNLEKENQQLKHNRHKALKIIDSYELGKYDYSIPPGGIIELREALKGDSDE